MSVASTYRGLTRSSYDSLDASVTTSVGTLTLDYLATALDAATIGNQEPSIILTTPAAFSILERLVFPTTSASYNAKQGYAYVTKSGFSQTKEGLNGEIGFKSIFYRGVPVVADEKCTSGYLYMLNEKSLYWASLPHPNHGEVSFGDSTLETVNDMPKNHGIAWTGLKEPINADGETGQFLLYGQLICDMPRFNAVLQGITGWFN